MVYGSWYGGTVHGVIDAKICGTVCGTARLAVRFGVWFGVGVGVCIGTCAQILLHQHAPCQAGGWFYFLPPEALQTTLGQEDMYARLLPSLTIELLIALAGSMQWWGSSGQGEQRVLGVPGSSGFVAWGADIALYCHVLMWYVFLFQPFPVLVLWFPHFGMAIHISYNGVRRTVGPQEPPLGGVS